MDLYDVAKKDTVIRQKPADLWEDIFFLMCNQKDYTRSS